VLQLGVLGALGIGSFYALSLSAPVIGPAILRKSGH
jgi:hypothetical protein